MSSPDGPVRAALVLGSGGARGYAHIGVIQVLEEHDVEVVAVAGSSMGALIGGLYAAGKLEPYTEWVSSLSQLQVLGLLDASHTGSGAIGAEKIFARLHELLDGVLIENLRIPYTAVATDLLARKAVWFQRGPVETAVRASIAMPGVFTPVMLNGRLLVDGGLMDPVPVAPTAAGGADLTVAVDLGGERRGGSTESVGSAVGESAEARPADEWVERFRRAASRVFDQDAVRALVNRVGVPPREANETRHEESEATPPGLRGFDVMNQSLEAMQSVLTRFRLAGNPPDLLITIPKDACRTFDFHRASEMIALGRTLATEVIDRSTLL
jgi:NTE family protein